MLLRLLLSALLGLVVCGLLLLAMALLIGGGPTATPAQRPAPKIEVVLMANTTAPAEPYLPPPPPLPAPPPAAPPAAPAASVAAPAAAAPLLDLRMPPLAAPNAGLAGTVLALAVAEGGALAVAEGGGQHLNDVADAGLSGAAGGAAVPLVRIEPRYPPKALREGKEGWVRLRFTIAADGTTKDIEVLDAKPRRLFEAEAKRALARWKYQPRIVDGRAVEQSGELVQLDFVLERP